MPMRLNHWEPTRLSNDGCSRILEGEGAAPDGKDVVSEAGGVAITFGMWETPAGAGG
jgi:hypothetical protein